MTHFADVASIRIPDNRMRKTFAEDTHKQLVASLKSKGLLHPIVCRKGPDATVILVAGERRLRAVKAFYQEAPGFQLLHGGEPCPAGTIPFTYLHELSEVEILEVELEENVCRADLPFIEQVAARKMLFDLRKKQAEAVGKSYGAEDLAKELQAAGAGSASTRRVFEELAVARFLDKPEVRGARTMAEAQKAAKKATENFFLEALGEAMKDATPPKHDFHQGDCLEILPTLPANYYDCVLTDPPYGIDIDDSGSMVTHGHHYADSADVLQNILERVPDQLYRITRAQAHVYWFCDLAWFGKICYALEQAGFVCCARPIIWHKRGKSMAPDLTRWPKRVYECIVYAIKGDKAPLKVADDLISTPYGAELQQAEKPKELYVELLSRSLMEGQKVIDPFCGSGVIFPAADHFNCAATGIEKDPMRAQIARLRSGGEEL